jgi:hypothetical protein
MLEGAPRYGGQRSTELGRWGYLSSSEMSDNGCGWADLRREISSAWQHNCERKRGKEERRPGGFIGAGGGRIWQGFNPIEEENQRGARSPA